jgi:hypothetical protein
VVSQEFRFRSLVLSRPSREAPTAQGAEDQADEHATGTAVPDDRSLAAWVGGVTFTDDIRRDLVDAPGGGPATGVATGEIIASGATGPLEGTSFPPVPLEDRAGVFGSREVSARPPAPAPAGHWVSARAVAGMAAGLVLPNLIIIGSGASREKPGPIRHPGWWRRRAISD